MKAFAFQYAQIPSTPAWESPMASKDELQNTLKEKYGINKNISQTLNKEECEQLLHILASEPSAVKLAEAFALKNSNLGRNNAFYSRMRNQAESKLTILQEEHRELEESIKTLEASKGLLEDKKKQLEQDREKLETEIQRLSARNNTLDTKVKKLALEKDELVEVNDELKRDNKQLKNLVDAIRLKLAVDVKKLMQYEDSEIRKALAKWFKGTQG